MPAPLSADAFPAIVDSAPDVIMLVDARGMIVYANRRSEDMFGYPPGELVGERIEYLVPLEQREIHQLNREVYVEDPHPRGMGVGLRLSARRRDGALVPVEISLSPYQAGESVYVVAIVRDVTDLRRQEEVVRRSEARLRLVTENAADMIFRYRPGDEPSFEYVSAAASALTGYSPEEFYAHPELAISFVVEEDREAVEEALWTGVPETLSVRAHRRDGALRWFECRLRRGRNSDGSPMTEGILRDVTERRAAEDESQRLLAEIETQLERERIAGDLHDDVIQSVYSLGLALHGDMADPAVTKSAALGRAIDGLNSVIADLRSYMRQLSGEHTSPLHEPFRPRIEALLSADGPQWTVEVADDLDLDESTERHVYLLMKELISNVTRHARAKQAVVTLRREHDGIELEVRDDGVGYDPANVPSSSYGLRSIDHRVAMLRASIETETAPNRGTVVRVHIPQEPSVPAAPSPPPTPPSQVPQVT
ncbi:MAG: PAS domain S-box protein [Dehalococcoidia bacterium]|nr:PAS domain S-box protein [Dehalococcoidia bacterium]